MLSLLTAVTTETIIGIIAIVVIVISVAIIVATAVRNYLLQKKMKEDRTVSEIDSDMQEEQIDAEGEIAAITASEEEQAQQAVGVEQEFGDEVDEEEAFQEIDANDISLDENGKMKGDDIENAKVEDNFACENIEKSEVEQDK